MLHTTLLFLLGIGGWKLFARLHVPAPDLIGALFMTSIPFILGYPFVFANGTVSLSSKLILGGYLGLLMDRSTLGKLKTLVVPASLVVLWMISLSIISGFILYKVTDLSVETAFLGSTAGGIAEMAIIGLSFHADTVTVTVLQLFRVVLFLLVMPFAAQWQIKRTYSKNKKNKHPNIELYTEPEAKLLSNKEEKQPSIKCYVVAKALLLMGTTLAGGILGKALGLPAGDMIGAMVLVGVMNTLLGPLPEIPSLLRHFARIGIGITMAQQLTPETIQKLSGLIIPVFLLGTLMLTSGFLLSRFLHRFTGWDSGTCLLVSSPAGISQMSIVAEEVGADPLVVSVLHTARLLSIIIFLPIFFKYFLF